MRLLFAARLSQLHEGETGLDTQEQEAVRWAESQGHTIVGMAADHHTGKSHLWDRPNLRPWVTRPEMLSQYDGILALHVDRLTRGAKADTLALEQWASDNYKALLISGAAVHFPSEGTEGAMWDMYTRMAHQEWLAIQERYARMQNAKHNAGSVIGRPPWGYEIVRIGDIKTLEPTPEGRIWVPRIFGWIISGWSARQVGKELERNSVWSNAAGGRWYESSIIGLVKTPTYSGQRVRKGRAALEVPALVSRAMQDKAIAVLASRARLGGTGNARPKALLAKLKCGHPDCPGKGKWPMYRIISRVEYYYYRCSGKGAQRQGCGAPLIAVETLNNLVLGFAAYWDTRPYVAQVFKPGNDVGSQVERLRGEMAEAIRLADADAIAGIAADYSGRIKELEDQGSERPHWAEAETGITEGEHLASLDVDGQREYLARKDIRAWKDAQGRICVLLDGALARTEGSQLRELTAG